MIKGHTLVLKVHGSISFKINFTRPQVLILIALIKSSQSILQKFTAHIIQEIYFDFFSGLLKVKKIKAHLSKEDRIKNVWEDNRKHLNTNFGQVKFCNLRKGIKNIQYEKHQFLKSLCPSRNRVQRGQNMCSTGMYLVKVEVGHLS